MPNARSLQQSLAQKIQATKLPKKTQKMMRGVTKTEGQDNNCCEDLI